MKSGLIKIAATLTFVLLTISSFAQKSSYEQSIVKIDSLISEGLPKSALGEVDYLAKLAKAENNPERLVKATLYRLLLQSYLEESAFKKIIDELKTSISNSTFPAKPIFQSILGEFYAKYYQQNIYKFSKRSSLVVPSDDFELWDSKTLIQTAAGLYQTSLANPEQLQKTNLGIFNGILRGDSSTRSLRPTLYDFLVHRALDFYQNSQFYSNSFESNVINDNRYFAPAASFAGISLHYDSTSLTKNALRLYQQAISFRLNEKQIPALVDLDLRRLNYVYAQSTLNNKDQLYKNALEKLEDISKNYPIQSDVLMAIAKYYQQRDSLSKSLKYAEMAFENFPASQGASNAKNFIKHLKFQELAVTIENTNLPDQSILANLRFKNIEQAQFKLYKVSLQQLSSIYKSVDDDVLWNHRLQLTEKFKSFLKAQTPLKDWILQLPKIDDLKSHQTEFSIEPLAAGIYILTSTSNNKDSLMQAVKFGVSRIAYKSKLVNESELEVFVLDRHSGEVIPNAEVMAKQQQYSNNKYVFVPIPLQKTNKDGIAKISLPTTSQHAYRNLRIEIRHNGDHYFTNEHSYYRDEKLLDDDENQKTIFFTDRQIYRPGQTVYFKAIQITDKKEDNKVVNDYELDISLKDANKKEITSQKLTTNEFGSVSGSFILPQNTLNGFFTLEGDDGQISFRVEEYKRPTLTINFNPLKENYHLNDTVKVSGKVVAFSGYGIANAKLIYKVFQTPQYNNLYYRSNIFPPREQKIRIKTDTIYTSTDGSFITSFKAAVDTSSNNYKLFSYEIMVAVTDESGETKEELFSLKVGDPIIQIQTLLEPTFHITDSLKIPVSLSNLNGQLQSGKVNLKIYSIKEQRLWFKNRLWDKPDILIIPKDEFKRQFPDKAYADEEEPKNFEKDQLIFQQQVSILETQPVNFILDNFGRNKSGNYLIEIDAMNDKGDTCSIKNYHYIYTPKLSENAAANWISIKNNVVKKGEKATYIVGIEQSMTALLEIFENHQLISTRKLNFRKGQNLLEIPYRGVKDTYFHLLAIKDNREYLFSDRLIEQSSNQMQLKFITFHDKLEPAQREQWKIQASFNSPKSAAELVATLYDASLNDINQAHNWNNKFTRVDNFNFRYLWNGNGINYAINSQPFFYTYSYFNEYQRQYEIFDLLGYDYYGAYNNAFHSYAARLKTLQSEKKLIEIQYQKSKEKYKNGIEVNGYVVDQENHPIINATILIKGTDLKINTGFTGKFKLRLPLNTVLLISHSGAPTIEYTVKSQNALIKLNITTSSLNEVVVVGYGTQMKSALPGAASGVTLRGNASRNGNASEEEMQLAVASMDMAPPVAVSPNTLIKKSVLLRSNFKETAFFYPNLRTNENGEFILDFTIPETLTKWTFKSFAHTANLNSANLETEIVTQKKLSISANMPRFFRENDTIQVSARLANLTAEELSGSVSIEFFNAMNNQPIKLLLNSDGTRQRFRVGANSTESVSFKLVVPQNIEVISYRLMADAGQFTDGEENTLPVLSDRMLVIESVPFTVRANQTKNYQLNKLVQSASSKTLTSKQFTIEYTPNPIWYAVQAIPYLVEYNYESAEQTFSKYFANSLSSLIIQKSPEIKRVFDIWKNSGFDMLKSNLEKNQELKSILLEESPWIKNAANETEQKQRIALLFDFNKMSQEKLASVEKLAKFQMNNGAFSWFMGGRYPDRYMTQHILGGIGKLLKTGAITNNNVEIMKIARKAIKYLDGELLKEHENSLKNKAYELNYNHHAWYVRSFFKEIPLSVQLKNAQNAYLLKSQSDWVIQSIYNQGLIGSTLLRNNQEETALKIIKSLKERAQNSDELGMYWPSNQSGSYWYQAPIETQSLMIEFFVEANDRSNAVEDMKIWLLNNKQTNNWKTTKATADACYALLLKNTDGLKINNDILINVGNTNLKDLTADKKSEAGTGYVKTSFTKSEIKPEFGDLQIKNNGNSIAWGAAYWQYLENLDKIIPSKAGLILERNYFINNQDGQLIKVDEAHQPKVGDQLKVIVYLTVDRDYDYVHLKDMRPAGSEPGNSLSGYHYQDNLYYYQVTKDVATNFFINKLRKGKYVFEYNLRIAQPGDFSTGISQVQCMYAPEFNAHSSGQRIRFDK